jgi:predicted outer membrane protein
MKSKLTVTSRFGVLALVLASMSFASLAVAEESPAAKSSSLSAKDKTFMHTAAKGGMMEVAMGRVAEQNGKSDDVKTFGQANGHGS